MRHLRGKPRLKLFQPTEMRGPDGATRRAHLLDLSATGALVHAADPPAVGGEVALRLSNAPRPGRVMWVDGRRFGVQFRSPLTDAEVEDALSTQAATVAEAGRRVGPITR